MKKTIYLIVFLYLLLINDFSFSQTWYPPQRLTSGNIDRNPSFRTISNTGNNLSIFKDFEFFTFVRNNSSYSQVCLGKINNNGLADSILYLTSGNYIHRNPSISYGSYLNYYDYINSSLVLWETNENSRWDIYGKFYSRQLGWGSQFAIDNSSGDKYSPQCFCIDSNTYAVVYAKAGDIIFKILNPRTLTVSYDTNLTVNDTATCFNPHLNICTDNSTRYYIVTYEKRKPDNKRAIYYRKNVLLTGWSVPDTVAYIGDNYFNSFSRTSYGYQYNFGVTFTSDRTGNKDIYLTSIPNSSGTVTQEKYFSYSSFYYYNYYSIFFPIITDLVNNNTSAMMKRVNDSVKVMLDFGTNNYFKDSTTICDTSKNVSITLGNCFNASSTIWEWVVYNKDSAGVSMIYGRKRVVNLGAISRISSIVPEKYSLEQNYPNPFNPTTNIKFKIKVSGFTTLKIFDALGRDVQTIVNEKLKPGEYEVTFDGSKLSSGVYFYKLQAGDFTETKKLILLK